MQHTLPKTLAKEHVDLVNDLFDWLIDPCIEFIKFNCKMQLQTSFIHLVTSMMRLFTCLLDEIAGANFNAGVELSAQVISLWLQGLFVFALIWGLGSTLNLDSRKKFDVFLRELINGMEQYPKPKNVKLAKVLLILNTYLNIFIYLK